MQYGVNFEDTIGLHSHVGGDERDTQVDYRGGRELYLV